ncbi:MAG: phage major capsid protein [Acidimicrobiia bacterium]|nr:phage major capsid protein [Acidimicrobiia bacterium]
MTTRTDLVDERENAFADADQYRDRYERGETLTDAERREWQRLLDRVDDLSRAIRSADHGTDLATERGTVEPEIAGGNRGHRDDGPARLGRPLGSRRFTDITGTPPGGLDDAFGWHLRASVTGDPIPEQFRDQTVGTGSEGGHMVTPSIAAGVWDMARARARTMQAGLTVVPFDAVEHRIPVQTEDAVPTWRAEADPIGTDSIVFARKVLEPKTLAVLVKSSRELVEDAPMLGSVISQSFARAFALAIDDAVLLGSGTNDEPEGITVNGDVGSTDLAASAPTWGDLVTAVSAIRGANEDPTAILLNTRDEATLSQQVGTANDHWLPAPSYIADVPRLETGQLPTDGGAGSDESHIVVGDYSQAVLGVRVGLAVQPLVERFMDNGQYGWVGWARCDVAIVRPAAFHYLEGVGTS